MNNFIKCPECNNKHNIISIDDCDINYGISLIQYYTCSCGCKFSEKYVHEVTTVYKRGGKEDVNRSD